MHRNVAKIKLARPFKVHPSPQKHNVAARSPWHPEKRRHLLVCQRCAFATIMGLNLPPSVCVPLDVCVHTGIKKHQADELASSKLLPERMHFGGMISFPPNFWGAHLANERKGVVNYRAVWDVCRGGPGGKWQPKLIDCLRGVPRGAL